MNLKDKIKIAFFDVDGTLINMEKKVVSEKTLEALIALKENGVITCIATGRPIISMPKIPGFEFDAFMAFNGSFCYTKDGAIFKNPIPKADVKQIIENAKVINRPVSVATEQRMGANGRDEDLVDYFAIAGNVVEVAEDFDELSEEDVYQIMSGGYAHEYDSLMENVEGAKITAWWHRAMDIIQAVGGKGLGVEKMLEYFNLTRDEAIAFGDGVNDIDMLQAVGIGVAMDNAKDEVKEAADVICGHVAEDGVFHFLKENKLI